MQVQMTHQNANMKIEMAHQMPSTLGLYTSLCVCERENLLISLECANLELEKTSEKFPIGKLHKKCVKKIPSERSGKVKDFSKMRKE